MSDAVVTVRRDYAKWAFFAVAGLLTLGVLVVDESFLFRPGDPEWEHIHPFRWLLMVHGIAGATALFTGPTQFSDRLRARKLGVHRFMGWTYVGAVAIASLMGMYIGFNFEPVTIKIEQLWQAGLWFGTTAIALVCILSKQLELHKGWMMKSYGMCLVFVTSRVPSFIPGFSYSDQLLADALWSLTAAALFVPDVILTVRRLARRKGR